MNSSKFTFLAVLRDFGGQIEIPRKFYDIIDHNKCSSSEKSAEKCILRNSYFHHSEPNHRIKRKLLSLLVLKLRRKLDSEDKITVPSNITYTEVVNEHYEKQQRK